MASTRNIVPFPEDGNLTNVLIDGDSFNRTALDFFNYTLYSNGTLSNVSQCYLVFDQYRPTLLANGTFVNGTSCYSPIKSMGKRGSLGIAFGTLFALSVIFTLTNLRKHGRSFLPREGRWRAVGRRWQWYWMLFVAACGIISTFTSVDVDRYYLPGLPVILQGFFYYLLLPTLLACVWETGRHWGSWQSRQLLDADPLALPHDPLRARKEFYLPLIFYLFAFLNFFMTIPRPWTPIQKQRSPSQTTSIALPSATDARFKAGSISAAIAWLIICYTLSHNITHYFSPALLLFPSSSSRRFPLQIPLLLILSLIQVAYNISSSFIFTISPLRLAVHPAFLYGLGYTPPLLIIIILNVYGYIDPNEDRVLLKQRAERGREADRQLGLAARTRKPGWWETESEQTGKAVGQQVGNMTDEVRDGAGHGKERFEMDRIPPVSRPDRNPFDDDVNSGDKKGDYSSPSDVPAPTKAEGQGRQQQQRQGQVVSSMLDV